MRLDLGTRKALRKVLDTLPVTNRIVAEHATTELIPVHGSDISKLKGGEPIGDAKWLALLGVLDAEAERAGVREELKEPLAVLHAAKSAAPGPRETPSSKTTKESLLGRMAVLPDIDEVHRAFNAIRWNVEVRSTETKLADILQSSEPIFYIDKDYSDAGQGLQALRDLLRDCLFSETAASFLPMEDRWFANLLRWPRAQSGKVICLFPFFLTPRRRFLWGVVPYGKLTHIGLLVSSQHPQRPQDGEEVDAAWLAKAIEVISGFSVPEIYIEPGYISEEIIVEAAINIDKANIRVNLTKSFRDLPPGFWESNTPKKDMAAFLKKIGPQSMMAFDLSLGDKISVCLEETGMRDRFCLLKFRNNVDVPVGVGFSLTSFPLLINTTKSGLTLYESLQTLALEYLVDSKLTSSLEKIGISIFGE